MHPFLILEPQRQRVHKLTLQYGVKTVAQQEARELLNITRGFLQDTRRGEIIRSGVRLAIFGPPNAGKSSLLNFLGVSLFTF